MPGLPENCQTTARQSRIHLPYDCRTTVGQLSDNCCKTVGQLSDNCRTTAWQLLEVTYRHKFFRNQLLDNPLWDNCKTRLHVRCHKHTFRICIFRFRCIQFHLWLDFSMKLADSPDSNCEYLKLMYLKRFWTGKVLGIVIVLTFASIFIALADWRKQGKEKWFKVQHYDYA